MLICRASGAEDTADKGAREVNPELIEELSPELRT